MRDKKNATQMERSCLTDVSVERCYLLIKTIDIPQPGILINIQKIESTLYFFAWVFLLY